MTERSEGAADAVGIAAKRPNVLAELKRRNVIRMAGLYLVGAWLIVQVAETLLPLYETPGWVLKVLVLLLALGFVPMLVFSWVFELTPDGLKRDGDVSPGASIAPQTARRMDQLIVAGLLGVVALVAADRFWPNDPSGEKGSESVSGTAQPQAAKVDAPESDSDPLSPVAETESDPLSTAPPNSIAVLPFVNMSADKDNEYFSDGISEELLNALANVEGMGVASRTSSFAYKGKADLGAGATGRELKVAHILEGSVRKSGTRVRITAQLIDAANDRHLWSETFDRELTDIFAIQDEIAKAIVAALRGTLGKRDAAPAVEVRADTGNLKAYDRYLKARELFIARSDLPESIRLFEQVVEMDPTFARGWEGLAAVTSVAPSWGIRDRDYDAMSIKAANRALELDPKLSMPWAVLSYAEQYKATIDWDKAFELIDRAIAADARNGTAFLWRGIHWTNLGHFQRAIDDFDRCLAVDPGYRNCVRWKAFALYLMGQEDAALVFFERGVRDGFITNRADSFVPMLVRRGDRVGAALLLREHGASLDTIDTLLDIFAATAPPKASAKMMTEIIPSDAADPFRVRVGDSRLYLWLGAFEKMDPLTLHMDADEVVQWERVWPEFRNSPAFKAMLERMNAPPYWRKHGFPPQCRAVGDKDFTCDAITR